MADFRERLSMRGDELLDRKRVLRRSLSQEIINEESLLLIARLGDPAAHQLCDEMIIRDDKGDIVNTTFQHEVLSFGSRIDAEDWLIEIYKCHSFEGMNRAGLSLLQRCRTLFFEDTDLIERAFELVEKRMFDGGNYSEEEYRNEMYWLYMDVSQYRDESLLVDQHKKMLEAYSELTLLLEQDFVDEFYEQLQSLQAQIKEYARLMLLAYVKDMIHWLTGAIEANDSQCNPNEEVQDGDVLVFVQNTTDCFAQFFRSFAQARKFQAFFRKDADYDQNDLDEMIENISPNMESRTKNEASPVEFESVRPFVLAEIVPWVLGEGDEARDRYERRNIGGVQGEGRYGMKWVIEGS